MNVTVTYCKTAFEFVFLMIG